MSAWLWTDAVDGDEEDPPGGVVKGERRAGPLVGGGLGDDDGPVVDPGVVESLVGEACGVVEAWVDRRYLSHHVGSGNLERVDRGVYRLLNYPSHPFEDVMATVLWVGDGAVASHDTALAIYGLADAMPAVIHITVPRRFRGNRPGVLIHRAPLPAGDATVRDGMPATVPLRTLLDAVSDPSVAAAAAEEAIEQGLIREGQLRRVVEEDPDLAGIFDRSFAP